LEYAADIWEVCNRGWTLQCKIDRYFAALINIINAIWFSRNQLKFNSWIIN